MCRFCLTPLRAAIGTVLYVPLWLGGAWLAEYVQWFRLAETVWSWGLAGLFLVGLAWLIWALEKAARQFEQKRRLLGTPAGKTWNPLDPAAWYYGRRSPRLRQSLSALLGYSLVFVLGFLGLTNMSGCDTRSFEMPAGGGQDLMPQQVQIQKVIRKRFVLNPYSNIIYTPPDINQVQLKVMEATQHAYKVGQGQGDGAGFSAGTGQGKVQFVRLRHADAQWNEDMGIGGDQNLMDQLHARFGMKIGDKTSEITIAELARIPAAKSPPLVYITGQSSFQPSAADRKVLEEYLLNKHGMIFGDNGGGRSFHNQFIDAMTRIVGRQPVPIPLDSYIHSRPYRLPFVPIVVNHGGTTALGWNVDGRWVCYYHPGDIGDAWADGHAGIKPEIAEFCYQLGLNIVFYAYSEKNKWLESQR